MLRSIIINASFVEGISRKSVITVTPQGRVPSPLVWLLAVNDIPLKFNREGKKIEAYADDVIIFVK